MRILCHVHAQVDKHPFISASSTATHIAPTSEGNEHSGCLYSSVLNELEIIIKYLMIKGKIYITPYLLLSSNFLRYYDILQYPVVLSVIVINNTDSCCWFYKKHQI